MGKLLEYFKNFRAQWVGETGKVWQMSKHNGWGHSIKWRDNDSLTKISGHLSGISIGDIVISTFRSGNEARFLVVDMSYCGNPPDLFFGTVIPLGWVGGEDYQASKMIFGTKNWRIDRPYKKRKIEHQFKLFENGQPALNLTGLL